MKTPTLSVVMPNYNHARYLPEALQTLLDQSYRPLEIIVMDDCSTDDSVEIIQSFARKDPLIRLVKNERNRGVNFTNSRLVEMAAGEYVFSAGADDLILPGMLERSMALLARYPQAGLCSTMTSVVDAATGKQTNFAPLRNIVQQENYIAPDAAMAWFRRNDNWILGNTCVYRRSALLDAGGFIPELHAFADGFIQMVLALKHGACFIPEPLAIWRMSSGGYASDSVSNLQVAQEMWSSAAHLMRTTYADLFPRDYVNKWEREHLYHARLSALNRLQSEQLSIIKGFDGSRSVGNRLFIFAAAVVMRLQFLILAGCLLLRFGRGILPVLTRGLRIALQRVSLKFRNESILRGEPAMELKKIR